MAQALTFTGAVPAAVSTSLDVASVHLWRLRYAPSEGRAPLRRLLAAYLEIEESTLVLGEAARGKPHIARTATGLGLMHGTQLEFNWSHSGEWALVALARGLAVGVDIERLDKPLRAADIARRFFDPTEATVLESLALDDRNRAFTGLWCAKEAVLKASGVGLSFGLERLAFARDAGAEWLLHRVDPQLGEAVNWQLRGFVAAPGYRGALAWHGKPRTLRTFELAPAPGDA